MRISYFSMRHLGPKTVTARRRAVLGSSSAPLPADQIEPSPFSARAFSEGDRDDAELAASIRQLGVLEPLLVRPIDGRYP